MVRKIKNDKEVCESKAQAELEQTWAEPQLLESLSDIMVRQGSLKIE